MIEATLLYGSKARGDHDRFSDTDLLGISSEGKILKPFDKYGVSFHIYPKKWLIEQAQAGALFLLHLVREAKVIHDPLQVFQEVQDAFRFKDSYIDQVIVGSQVVLATLSLDESKFTNELRRRYFWGVRTALMAKSAEARVPSFSALALENTSEIHGLALHIQTRDNASFAECQRMGRMVLECVRSDIGELSSYHKVRNELIEGGGVGKVTANEITYM